MKNTSFRLSALLVAAVAATSAVADLTPYSQDFEGLNAAAPDALENDGWLVYGNVFTAQGGYIYGYGPYPAPNHSAAFSQIATGEAGPAQGTQYLNVFSDYNNTDHGIGRLIESNVFQEQNVGAADVGQTYVFTFDYKASSTAGPGGATTAFAFIKVLDPRTGYTLVAFPTVETTTASTSVWSNGNTIDITIQSGWDGNILQFGFMNTATAYEPSGVYYDNVSFAPVPEPASMTVLAVSVAGLVLRRRRR